MPKGYIISRVDVVDPEAYAHYAAAATKVIAEHGGRPLARGGRWRRWKARPARATSCSNSKTMRRRAATIIRSSIRRPRRCARERRKSKWFWSREFEMAKGYWIAHVDVTDPEAYQAYVRANAVAFAKFGGRFLVRGGPYKAVEGVARARQVVIEFKDYATALACYNSQEYQQAKDLRAKASQNELVIVEGYDGPQPG